MLNKIYLISLVAMTRAMSSEEYFVGQEQQGLRELKTRSRAGANNSGTSKSSLNECLEKAGVDQRKIEKCKEEDDKNSIIAIVCVVAAIVVIGAIVCVILYWKRLCGDAKPEEQQGDEA